MTTPPKVVERILDFSLANSMWGCVRLSNQLKLKGVFVSSLTIQNILIKHELGSRDERLLKLEEQALDPKIDLSAEQVKAIEKATPSFKERHVERGKPGELLCQVGASARSTCKPSSIPTVPTPSAILP